MENTLITHWKTENAWKKRRRAFRSVLPDRYAGPSAPHGPLYIIHRDEIGRPIPNHRNRKTRTELKQIIRNTARHTLRT